MKFSIQTYFFFVLQKFKISSTKKYLYLPANSSFLASQQILQFNKQPLLIESTFVIL
jgi:hypothetical protein